MSAPAYERIRDAAAATSSPTGPSGATSPRLYSPAPAALTATVTGQSPTPGGSQVYTDFSPTMAALRLVFFFFRYQCDLIRGLAHNHLCVIFTIIFTPGV